MASKKRESPFVDDVGEAFRIIASLDASWSDGVAAGLALSMLRVAARLWTRSGLDGAAFVDACSVAWRHAQAETASANTRPVRESDGER